VFGPKQLAVIFSLLNAIGFGMLGMWSSMVYYLAPFFLRFVMDLVIFYIYPVLDVPLIPWWYVWGQFLSYCGFSIVENTIQNPMNGMKNQQIVITLGEQTTGIDEGPVAPMGTPATA
jgi:hypothetical protein